MSFEAVQWQPVPLRIGLSGPTGSGKTKSGLELAAGITGGHPFAFLDTERGRGRHYVKRYPMIRYDQLEPPFTPQRYLEKMREAAKAGFPLVLVDSGSHMWEGKGGLRDAAADKADELAKRFNSQPDKFGMLSWKAPKEALDDFIEEMHALPCHLIMTFRAKEKLKQAKGANGRTEIVNTGFKPITEHSFPFEMTLFAMFSNEAPGVPSFEYKTRAEYLPNAFGQNQVITARHGQALLKWSQEGEPEAKTQQDRRSTQQSQPAEQREDLKLELRDVYGQLVFTDRTALDWMNHYRTAMKEADAADRPDIGKNNLETLRKVVLLLPAAQGDLERTEALIREDEERKST